MRTKDIVMLGMMSAILLVVQVALRFIPNVELVSLLIIIYTLVFGSKTIFQRKGWLISWLDLGLILLTNAQNVESHAG